MVDAEVVDSVADGLPHRLVEVGVEANGDPVVGGFGEGAGDRLLRRIAGCAGFEHGEADGGAQGALDGGEGDFAVSLSEVGIGDEELCSLHLHGKVKGCAGDEVMDVEIAAVVRGRDGVGSAGGGRGDADGAEEGVGGEGNGSSLGSVDDAVEVAVDGAERDELRGVVEFFRMLRGGVGVGWG